MQPDRYMPMPSVHYGENSIIGPKSMRRFCDNLIQIHTWNAYSSKYVLVVISGSFRKDTELDNAF